MRVNPQPCEVRRLVARAFETLGVAADCLGSLDETILIQEGRYMARSYRVAGMMAMWLVEIGIVQFYDDQGNMLRTINLLEETEPIKVAA
jgi:hypothetical protein